MRHQAILTIPITVTRQAGQPLHEQIATQVGTAVEHGLLAHRTQLPSTRTLASLLGVSRGVATAAYELLFTRGYLESHPGSGTYVAGHPASRQQPGGSGRTGGNPAARRRPGPTDRAAAPPRPLSDRGAAALPRPPAGRPGILDLRPGQVDIEACPLPAWRAAWRRASFNRPPAQPLPPLGLPELRRAVAEHLARQRGVTLAGRDVIITGGTAHGLRLVLDALGLRGRQVAIEEPVPPALHRAAGGETERPAALPVDGDGARVDLVGPACRAIVVSADAQVPLGHVLSAPRRRAAVAWGASTGGHIVEIACDPVFRPSVSQLPRLYGPAGTRSILVGGFCELLTPALNLGYALVPRDLTAPVARLLGEYAAAPPYLTQLALASLLRDGVIVRLMHRLGRRYATRRRIVESSLAPLRRVRLGARHGVNTEVLHLPDQLDARQVAERALAHGVRVSTLAPYHFSGRRVPPALVIGFGHQPDSELRRSMSRLVDALSEPF
ncbi:PLP-dependent aminotransferase family protein [Micromonospora sp. NPDC050397]|uniref:aminotransferase-like domain-containing protein n=1 Tax=Micromonospora sp. NPDC050397 TaxID=3364279 RepID=UPI00384F6ACD